MQQSLLDHRQTDFGGDRLAQRVGRGDDDLQFIARPHGLLFYGLAFVANRYINR